MLLGESASGEAGLGLDFAGDVDSDGIVDVLVGASGDTRGGRGAGAAYLVLGDITDDVSLADADLIVTGESGADAAGAEVDGAGEVAHDDLQAHHDVACGAALQEVGSGIARGGPVQPPAQEVAVEDPGGRGGGRHEPGQ
jgi:hypothetical protein